MKSMYNSAANRQVLYIMFTTSLSISVFEMAAFICQLFGLNLNNNWMCCHDILSRLCLEDNFL